VDEGADMLDVGGESTRPGAARVSVEEQVRRVIPAIEAIRGAGITAPISVDTTREAVARAALDAGADAINDVSGGTEDPALLDLVAERHAGLVLMHRLRAPNADRYSDQYGGSAPVYEGGVVEQVLKTLRDLAREARDAGVAAESIVIDPGLGFGKTVEQNFALIAATGRFASLGYGVLCGASRKSFIGKASGVEDPASRVEGSMAASVAQRLAGGNIFRIHDVGDHARALRVADAILGAGSSGG
jgi:dihydropteroate synthase